VDDPITVAVSAWVFCGASVQWAAMATSQARERIVESECKKEHD